VVITISAIGSAILLKGVIDKEKAGLSSEKSVLKWEIIQFEERKKILNDSLIFLNDSIYRILLREKSQKRKEDSLYQVAMNLIDRLNINEKQKQELIKQFDFNKDFSKAPSKTWFYVRYDRIGKDQFKTDDQIDSIFKSQFNNASKDRFKLVKDVPFVSGMNAEMYLLKDKEYRFVIINKKFSPMIVQFSYTDGTPIIESKYVVGTDQSPLEIPFIPDHSGYFEFSFYQETLNGAAQSGRLLFFEKQD
jgi:hypothetical protein